MPRSFLVKKTEKVRHVVPGPPETAASSTPPTATPVTLHLTCEPKERWIDSLGSRKEEDGEPKEQWDKTLDVGITMQNSELCQEKTKPRDSDVTEESRSQEKKRTIADEVKTSPPAVAFPPPPPWMLAYAHHNPRPGFSPLQALNKLNLEGGTGVSLGGAGLFGRRLHLGGERMGDTSSHHNPATQHHLHEVGGLGGLGGGIHPPPSAPFIPYTSAIHPLSVRMENNYLQDLMSSARASLFSTLHGTPMGSLPDPAPPSPPSPPPPISSSSIPDEEVTDGDKSSIFGLDLRTTRVSDSATSPGAPPSPPPSDSSSISPGRESVSSRSAGSRGNSFQSGITVAYTYDAFFLTDGRSRKKNPLGLPEKTRMRYTCNECGKNYATSSNLSRHKQTHRSLDSQQAKKCPHCEKKYVSMPALSMHILTHELKHQCPVCNKSFSRPWLLQGHMRSHSGEKPYGCAHCGKAFADRSNLRAHMQTHSVYKSYECQRCHKSFALKSYLNKHYESACFKDGLECQPLYRDAEEMEL